MTEQSIAIIFILVWLAFFCLCFKMELVQNMPLRIFWGMLGGLLFTLAFYAICAFAYVALGIALGLPL